MKYRNNGLTALFCANDGSISGHMIEDISIKFVTSRLCKESRYIHAHLASGERPTTCLGINYDGVTGYSSCGDMYIIKP